MAVQGYKSTSAGKKVVIDQVKEILQNTEMVIAVPSAGVSGELVTKLRMMMPEVVKLMVVKNTLFRKAAEGTRFAVADPLLNNANMWMFVKVRLAYAYVS
jgi:ribosomal protein L10